MTAPDRSAVPTVALVARRGETAALAPLLRALARTVTVTPWRPEAPAPDAVIATSRAALAPLEVHWNGPTVVRITGKAGTELLVGGPGDAEDPDPATPTRSRVTRIPLPNTLVEIPDWDPMPTLIRARWRTRLGWPDVVVVPPGHGSTHVPADHRPDPDVTTADAPATGPITLLDLPAAPAARVTALALASAAVITRADLPTAIALATPTVCVDPVDDPDLADIVESATSVTDAITRACTIARDGSGPRRAAAAITYRRTHRMTELAHAVLAGLGLAPEPSGLADHARERLHDVGLPADSPLTRRVHDAFAAFGHSTPHPVAPIHGDPDSAAATTPVVATPTTP